VVDSSKQASVLAKPVPVAVLPDGKSTVAEAIENLGGEPSVRAATEKDGPVVTDNGNIVIDCSFGQIETPEQLGTQLSAVPGVVEHGLFVDLVDEAHIGDPDGVDIRKFGDTHSV
jgi:ribose 5-phosphate isomerase A